MGQVYSKDAMHNIIIHLQGGQSEWENSGEYLKTHDIDFQN